MIILSCYIYTNTILYTVEIQQPRRRYPTSGGTQLPSILRYIQDQKLSQFRIMSWEVKTPSQYYIIWIKYPLTPHPKAKTKTPLVQAISICTTLCVFFFLNNQFHSLFVLAAAAWMRGQEGHGGHWGPRLSCSAECVKSTGMKSSCAGRYDTLRVAAVFFFFFSGLLLSN